MVQLLAASACDETGVVLRLRYQLRVPEQLDALCVQIATGDELQFARHHDLSEENAGRPATLSVAQGESSGFEVMLRALRRGWTVSFERAGVQFTPHERPEETIAVPGCHARARGQISFARKVLTPSMTASALVPVPLSGQSLGLIAFASGTAQLYVWRPGSDLMPRPGVLPRAPADAVRQVIATDLDNDCALDLVILTDSGATVWRQWPEGKFDELGGALKASGDLRRGVAARIDDDPLTDLALISGDSVVVYLNQSGNPGHFSEGIQVPGSAESIAAGIADTDRFPDLVLTRAGQVTQVLHRREDNASTFDARPLSDPRGAAWAITADLDGVDRIDEVITARQDEIAIYRRGPRAGADFGVPVTLKAPGIVNAMLTVDLDGNCYPDLVLATSQGLALSLNDNGTLSSPAVIDATLAGANQIAVGDPDGDGRNDLLLGGDPTGLVWLRQMP